MGAGGGPKAQKAPKGTLLRLQARKAAAAAAAPASSEDKAPEATAAAASSEDKATAKAQKAPKATAKAPKAPRAVPGKKRKRAESPAPAPPTNYRICSFVAQDPSDGELPERAEGAARGRAGDAAGED